MTAIRVETIGEADALLDKIRAAAKMTQEWIAGQSGDPLDMLSRMKFEPIGFHPVEHRPLNVIEQLNQTFSFAVAAMATKQLLEMHPSVGGFWLAPGAHMSRELDIMSVAPGVVGAETFAAVHPSNNEKLAGDLRKLAARQESHRYVFFMSPRFPANQRQQSLERDGVEVWSVTF